MKKKVIIGRHELISFPLLELYNIEAKIDTGAYTSAIYCSELIPKENGIYCKTNDNECIYLRITC